MSRAIPPGRSTWAHAAATLALRVHRRARHGAAFTRIGASLLAAACLALLWRALGPRLPGSEGTIAVLGLLALGLCAGAWLAHRTVRLAARVPDDAAAWALDRLAAAGGRGLAAAAARGPGASEAAFADGGLEPPPAVRLHPPRGLALLVGALLLATLAIVAPQRSSPRPADVWGGGMALGGARGGEADGPAASAARAESRARALQAEADAARQAREALNLPADGPLDPKEVAERLADPRARQRAAEAAGSGSELAGALDATDTSAEAVARLIGRGEDNQGEASGMRREAAGARARLGVPAVPPARRNVVQQYLRLVDRDRAR